MKYKYIAPLMVLPFLAGCDYGPNADHKAGNHESNDHGSGVHKSVGHNNDRHNSNNHMNEHQTLDEQLRQVISNNALTGTPFNDSASLPLITDEKATLGKRLFFSKTLAGARDSACASCHHPMLGGGDDLSLPIGGDAINPDLLGPSRLHAPTAEGFDNGPTVPRNAPTTFNIAAWQNVLFHDGRVTQLEGGISTPDSGFGVTDALAGSNLVQAQSRFPVTSPEEMKGFAHHSYDNQGIRDLLAGRLGGYGDEANTLIDTTYWLTQFQSAFDRPDATAEEVITEQNISIAIGEYERSQVFINTPWKAYIDGNNAAISRNVKEGALLFFGEARCSSCHSGDFFTDEQFHNIAAPQIGRGKGHGDGSEDFGRSEITGNGAEIYKFRTPTLLNVEETGPWTHAGAYTTLEAVVRHHLNPQTALDEYDFAQLAQSGIQNLDVMKANTQKAVDALEAERIQGGTAVLQNVELTDAQVSQIVDFLKALTDPCVQNRDCMAPWIADEVEDVDPNADLLIAVDQNGVKL
ncbi:MAG TPA: cytochrome-c peroxidase [Gammaproteobacteria bacterium]|nr:cytochrome-c peroxidase [Gammaproteobacteria bacterium]